MSDKVKASWVPMPHPIPATERFNDLAYAIRVLRELVSDDEHNASLKYLERQLVAEAKRIAKNKET